VPRLLLLIAALAIFTDQGIVAVAACQVGAGALFLPLTTALAARLLRVSAATLLRELWPPLVAAGLMGAVLLVVERTLAPWPAVIAGAIIGAGVYLGVMWVLRREALEQLWRRLRPGRDHHLAKS
jgi:hypothetical protein